MRFLLLGLADLGLVGEWKAIRLLVQRHVYRAGC